MNDTPPPAAAVESAITSRRSIRAFLPTPVPRETVEHLLAVAGTAPSGSNMQPWKVYVLAGETKEALSAEIVAAHDAGDPGKGEFRYYPEEFPDVYLARRRATGWGLYAALGIEKGDKARMHAQYARNYRFFDAPVGLIFTIDRALEIGSWLDYGMFLQNIMVMARALGLHTCPQAAFAPYHEIIRRHLPIPDGEVVVCGMSLGHADPDAPENAFQPEREPVDAFTTFAGL